jgi:hypothetical protein
MLNPQSGETELVFEFGQYIKQTEVATLAPTYSQCFRWFREKHGLYSVIDGLENRQYYKITQLNTYSKEYNTYEEAELECVKELIKIIKNKN